MKALSLTQPWATLVAIRAKRYETRSWRSQHLGRIAIHAAKGFPLSARELCLPTLSGGVHNPFAAPLRNAGYVAPSDLPLGAIVAVCDIAGYFSTARLADIEGLSERERAFGDYSVGRWAWRLENVIQLKSPVPCGGALGLWTVPADIEALVLESEVPA